MDITNIPQNLIKALEQKSTEQLAVLSRVLNLVLGKTVMASVVSTAPVTATEREELLKQTTAALTQLNQQAVGKLTPAIKNEIARLLQQQQLVQSPELKWINLVVNNRPLLTYSDRPVTAGQSIPIQLQSPQKLVILDLPVSDAVDVVADPAPAKNSIPPATSTASNPVTTQQPIDTKTAQAVTDLVKSTIAELTNKTFTAPGTEKNLPNSAKELAASNLPSTDSEQITKSLPQKMLGARPQVDVATKNLQQQKINLYNTNDLSLKLSTKTEIKQNNSETISAKAIVSEQLRNLLPHRDTPDSLLSAVLQLQKMPATARAELFPPSVEQALKSIAEKIRAPEQLAQPKALAQTLKNSGIFFESKLNELTTKENSAPANSHKFNNTFSQDLKGSLLTLLNRTTQELSGTNKPISSEQTLRLFQNLGSVPTFNSPTVAALAFNNKNDITQILGAFVQELMQKPVKELSNKELRSQLLVLLQQHSLHSLAKIQLQQLHSVNHELETRDTNAPASSWQFEIPVRHHNEVQQLHMRIDREWVDEKNESEPEKAATKIKQWSVTLRFDLPTLGEFCAQLAIVNTQVSATLWAAQEKTFTEVREHIEGLRKQLESEGINVKYLQCMRGMPPQKPMALSYSLIDIST